MGTQTYDRCYFCTNIVEFDMNLLKKCARKIKTKLLYIKQRIILLCLSLIKKTIIIKTQNKILESKKDAPFVHRSKNLVINIEYPGLGDHLFYSHLPRIAKETKKYDHVYVSQKSNFRNPDTKKLIWDMHPCVDGVSNEKPKTISHFTKLSHNMNLLDKIMLDFELDDGKRFHEPEIHIKPKVIPFLKDKIVYDPNYISLVGKLRSKSIQKFLQP